MPLRLESRWWPQHCAAAIVLFAMAVFVNGKLKTADDGVFCVGFVLVASLVLNWILQQVDRKLAARESASSENVVVHPDGAGQAWIIPGAHYARLQRQVLADPRNAFAQLMNLLSVARHIVWEYATSIPLVIIWGGIGLAIFAPAELRVVVETMQTVDASVMRQAVLTALGIWATATMVAVPVLAAMGYRFGWRNRYREALDTALSDWRNQSCSAWAPTDLPASA